MPTKTGTGDLTERVGFDSPKSASDGGGGTLNGFAEQFERRAQFIHLRGGESILAGRLQGQHTQVIRVRACPKTRTITTDWRVTDKRRGTEFNIREVVETVDRMWIDVLAQRGVAT